MDLIKTVDLGLMPLSETEYKNIEGGSELTDAIWYGIGYAVGTVSNVCQAINNTVGSGVNTWSSYSREGGTR